MATEYPKQLLVRLADPGTDGEFMIVGTQPDEVDDTVWEGVLHPQVARYQLVGVGHVHYSAPVYVEDPKA